MSDATNTEQQEIDLTTISPELRQVIEFDEVPKEMHFMVTSIHEVSEEAVREAAVPLRCGQRGSSRVVLIGNF